MLVANTKEAIDTCTAIFRIWPELMAQVHLPGPFIGENLFHVLAVNRQVGPLHQLRALRLRLRLTLQAHPQAHPQAQAELVPQCTHQI